MNIYHTDIFSAIAEVSYEREQEAKNEQLKVLKEIYTPFVPFQFKKFKIKLPALHSILADNEDEAAEYDDLASSNYSSTSYTGAGIDSSIDHNSSTDVFGITETETENNTQGKYEAAVSESQDQDRSGSGSGVGVGLGTGIGIGIGIEVGLGDSTATELWPGGQFSLSQEKAFVASLEEVTDGNGANGNRDRDRDTDRDGISSRGSTLSRPLTTEENDHLGTFAVSEDFKAKWFKIKPDIEDLQELLLHSIDQKAKKARKAQKKQLKKERSKKLSLKLKSYLTPAEQIPVLWAGLNEEQRAALAAGKSRSRSRSSFGRSISFRVHIFISTYRLVH